MAIKLWEQKVSRRVTHIVVGGADPLLLVQHKMRFRNMMRLFRQPKQTEQVTPFVAPDTRVYAIGDIHGCHDLMIRMLDKIQSDARSLEDDRVVKIVFLGDYIDRGDDSAMVLETLHRLSSDVSGNVFFLKGNHEASLLTFLEDPLFGKDWLNFGGKQTLASFGITARSHVVSGDELHAMADELAAKVKPYLPFLKSMPVFHQTGNVVFCHAGLSPRRGVDEQHDEHFLWGHSDFLQDCPLPGFCVVHGHYDNPKPVSLAGRICIDTGAYYSGTLTAVRMDEAVEFLSVRVGLS